MMGVTNYANKIDFKMRRKERRENGGRKRAKFPLYGLLEKNRKKNWISHNCYSIKVQKGVNDNL